MKKIGGFTRNGWISAWDGQSFHETTENIESTRGIPLNNSTFSFSVFFLPQRGHVSTSPFLICRVATQIGAPGYGNPQFWDHTEYSNHHRSTPVDGRTISLYILAAERLGPCPVPPVRWPPRSDQRHRSDVWRDCSWVWLGFSWGFAHKKQRMQRIVAGLAQHLMSQNEDTTILRNHLLLKCEAMACN